MLQDIVNVFYIYLLIALASAAYDAIKLSIETGKKENQK